MTLVELLVVVTIILLLAAVTIPRLRPEMEKSRVREAARSIQLYLSSARALAMATGRSCGVMIERLPAEPGCSMSLTQVETPVPYGGDLANSFATVTRSANTPNDGFARCDITLFSAPNTPMVPSGILLYQGDLIQVGYQGFKITLDERNTVYPPGSGLKTGAINTGAKLKGKVNITHGELPAWTVQPISGPFTIIREPVKSAAPALQLPSPACIDLTWSGVDQILPSDNLTWNVPSTKPPQSLSPNDPLLSSPILILFSPNGSVDQVYRYVASTKSFSATRVISPIYLLVGNRQNVVNPPDPANQNTNLNNIANLWVAINASTGMTFVTDMAAAGKNNATLQQSRLFARESSAMGGK